MPIYEYDRFGYCILCSKQVMVKELIGKDEVLRQLPEYKEGMVRLSDGSKMRICMCEECFPKLAENAYRIMTKVYKGWEYEVSGLDWPQEKKDAYLDRYSKLSIAEVL